ncbi:hypothetical protein [Mucilaginibacter paludis]|uniref:Ribosomal protein L7/L12 C-terminal domain-containing protein n=1 Tax=Mucilaginibacter paludis DSM 18603 TaxID=714943 RepID=H1Y6X7_9SPHI|nr:hypothetical protein [Mucilaginibacter paludis]EHQ28384.1 hypothetical protein Mucpa_4294 [Mucilaginibacter paludis DSM 18603]
MVLSKAIEAEVQTLIMQNRRLRAVKLVVDTTGCGLKDAKDFVDSFAAGQGVPVVKALPEGLDAQLNLLLSQGKKLNAVKLYKEATGLGLAQSKDYIDKLEQGGALFGDKPISGKRDTAIDEIIKQQSQSKGLVQVSSGTSPIRLVLFFLLLIAAIALLKYLFNG